MTESHDNRLKKLHFRSWHRGCKETDLLFGRFADSGLSSLTAKQLNTYEALLEEHDADVWSWVTGKTTLPEDTKYSELLDMMKKQCDAEVSAMIYGDSRTGAPVTKEAEA